MKKIIFLSLLITTATGICASAHQPSPQSLYKSGPQLVGELRLSAKFLALLSQLGATYAGAVLTNYLADQTINAPEKDYESFESIRKLISTFSWGCATTAAGCTTLFFVLSSIYAGRLISRDLSKI